MTYISYQLNELELLSSAFSSKELLYKDKQTEKIVQCYIESGFIPSQVCIDIMILVDEKVELSVKLPDGYPSLDPSNPIAPIITLRFMKSEQHIGCTYNELFTEFNETLKELSSTGDPVLFALINWLRDKLNILDRINDDVGVKTLSDQQVNNGESKSRIVCLWIVSHHIQSPVKRRLIIEWSRELGLQGCSMPGKPGLIVVEGEDENADEFWKRLRNLQWKQIQLRDRECMGNGLYISCRFSNGFQELLLPNHSRFQWLHNNHHVTIEQFKLVFGIPARSSK